MPLLEIVLVLVAIGFGLYLINAYVPMDTMIKKFLNIVIVVCTAVWLLKEFGLWHFLSSITVG